MESAEYARYPDSNPNQLRITPVALFVLACLFCVFEEQSFAISLLESAITLGVMGILDTQDPYE